MDDTIRRQAAIEVVLNFVVEYLGGAFDEQLQKVLLHKLHDLPSAQQEIVRCSECKHYGDYHFCCYPWCTTPEEFCSRGERRE